MTTVLYPGSFDPIHLGHLDVIEQAAELSGTSSSRSCTTSTSPPGLFGVDERIDLIMRSAAEAGIGDHVAVTSHSGLAVDAATAAEVDFIVKGLRTAADFEIEQQMALTNYSVTGVRTVYLPCRADRGFISSRFVREIARYGGAISHLVPAPVATPSPPVSRFERQPMSYDDQNYYEEDDYDDIDDEYPEPGTGYVGDAETLLRRCIDIIANAPKMPLSSSPRIDRDEIIELLEEALAAPARRAPPGALDAQGAPGVRHQDPPRSRRDARSGAGSGRADGAAHRGRQGGRAACPPGHGGRRDRLRGACVTRPRTSSTSGSAVSRSCSTSSKRPSGPGASGCRSARPPSRSIRSKSTTPPRDSSTRTAEMSGRPALLVNALELLRVPGTRKHVSDLVPPAEVDAASPAIVGDIAVEVDLESTIDDIGLSGSLRVRWSGHCRRCLRPLAETVEIDVDERYADESGQPAKRSRSCGARSISARWSARRCYSRSVRPGSAGPTAPGSARSAARM